MKAVVIVLSIIAFVACLLIGMQAGSGSLRLTDPTHSTNPPTPGSTSEQRTVLVILVDDLQATHARLAGLWIVFYRPDTPHLMLLPLYPADQTDDLAKTFSLSNDHHPSAVFLKSVQDFHFSWDGYVLIDPTAAAALIDDLENRVNPGEKMDGKSTLASLIMPWDQWDQALISQKSLGKAVCDHYSQLSPKFDSKQLLQSLPVEHFRSNIDLDQLDQDWKSLNGTGAPLNCEFANP